MCKLLVDIHRLMKLHVTCYFTINQHKSKYICRGPYIYLKEMHICLLNDISIMHYVQFGSNISPDYVMPADTPRHVKPYNISYPLSMFWIWKNTPSPSLISHEAEPSGIWETERGYFSMSKTWTMGNDFIPQLASCRYLFVLSLWTANIPFSVNI